MGILKNRTNSVLIIILLLATFLRLYHIADYMTFLGDEGRDAIVLTNLVDGTKEVLSGNLAGAKGRLTLLGPTASVGGFFMGPAYYYMSAPFFFLFGNHPVGPSVMVALLSIATILLLYHIGKEFFSEKVGVIAAFLYAISPVVLVYSRASWNPNVMPFFTLLTMYTLYKAVQLKKWWLMVLAGVLYGIDMQLHYIELFVGAAIILYVFVFYFTEKKLTLLQKLGGIVKEGVLLFIGFLIGMSPFLAFEIRHDFQNLQNIYNFIFFSKETGGSTNFLTTLWDVFFRLFGRIVLNFPRPQEFSFQHPTTLSLWYWTGIALALAALSTFLLHMKNTVTKRDKFLQYVLLLLWFGIGLFLFGFYNKAIHDYYFEFLFPLPFLFVGLLLVHAPWRAVVISVVWYILLIVTFYHLPDYVPQVKEISKQKGIVAVIYGLPLLYLLFVTIRQKGTQKEKLVQLMSGVVLFGIAMIDLQGYPFQYAPNKQMQQSETIANFVLEKAEGKPFNFAIITGGNSDHAYRFFFKRANREPVVIQYPGIDPERKTATDQLFVVCESLPCSPPGHSLWEIAGYGRAEVAAKWKVSVVEVYKLVPYKEKKN